MKIPIMGLIILSGILIATNTSSEVKYKTVNIRLIPKQVVTLSVTPPVVIIPEAEDYAIKFSDHQKVIAGSIAPEDDYGFADRPDAIKVSIFTNAYKGVTVFLYGLANHEHNNTLRVEDVYLTVMTEKTYVLMNKIEGAWAHAKTEVKKTKLGLPHALKYQASWIQCNNEPKEFFGVKMSTKAVRDWWLKLGIGNLARYTENEEGFDMDLTFILMPIVE